MFAGLSKCISVVLEPCHRTDVTLMLKIDLQKLKSLQSSWALGYLLSCQDQAADENCDQRKNCASPKNASSGECSLKAASGANERESEVQVSSRRQEQVEKLQDVVCLGKNTE